MKILITAALTGAAQRLKNTLNLPEIMLGDYLELPVFMAKSGGIIGLPNPASVAYQHQMLAFCLDKEIQRIYILRGNEQTALKEAELLFKEYGVELVFDVDLN